MGVKKLHSFFKNRCTIWRHENIVGNVVIDGSGLCYHLYVLYDLDWAEGGQYPEYRTIIEGFFGNLKSAKLQPTVVFDGIDLKNEKLKVRYDRHKRRARNIYKLLMSRQPPGANATNQPTNGTNILPPMAYEVFQETLRQMGIPVLLADGEGDITIAQLAHHLKCPVISQDSDFYMFHLPWGYIPLNPPKTFGAELKVDIYYESDFLKHFQFRNESLRFLIPAIMGNDFLQPLMDIQSSICHLFTSSDLRQKHEECLYLIVLYISECDSLEHFLSAIPQTTPSDEVALQENYSRAKDMYSVLSHTQDSIELVAGKKGIRIPQWLLDQFRRGKLAPFLLEAQLLKFQFMSCSLTSKLLRQHMYSMLGVHSVTEYPINDGKVNEESVDASVCIRLCTSSLAISEIHERTLAERNQLYYNIVKCDQHKIETLQECWRLAITSVIFWARECQPKPEKDIIKALVLCMQMHCKQEEHYPKIRCEVSELCASKSKLENSTEAFTEWQFTYLDTMALNQLLMEPLEFVSPAELYDGQIATRLASDRNFYKTAISKYDKALFTRLLSIVFSQPEQNTAEQNKLAQVPSTTTPGYVKDEKPTKKKDKLPIPKNRFEILEHTCSD